MLKSIASVGQNAAKAALEKARSSGATALIAATLLPLAAITPAQAGSDLTVTTTFNGDGTETFTLNATGFIVNFSPITTDNVENFYIPEVNLGDLNFSSWLSSNQVLAGTYGITITEYLPSNTQPLGGAPGNITLPTSVAAYVDIAFSGGFVGNLSLIATVPYQTGTTANGDAYFQYSGDITTNNFSIPSNSSPTPPPTNVPEPGSLALLGSGLMGLLGLRRRKC